MLTWINLLRDPDDTWSIHAYNEHATRILQVEGRSSITECMAELSPEDLGIEDVVGKDDPNQLELQEPPKSAPDEDETKAARPDRPDNTAPPKPPRRKARKKSGKAGGKSRPAPKRPSRRKA